MTIDSAMKSLADAVRGKTGISGKLSISGMTDAVNSIELNTGGDIDFSGVNVTAGDLRNGVVAINSSGIKITGNIQDVELQRNGNTVSIAQGYTQGGSVTIEQQETELPDVSFAAADLRVGKTAINSNGEVVSGAMTDALVTLTGNVVSISGGYAAQQSVVIPLATVTETETSVTIGAGFVPEQLEYELGGGGGNAYFVRVDEFIAPVDAYTAVEAVVVSGFGEAETGDGTEDYSAWNGTYRVTPATAVETTLEKRIFKHTTENKYIVYGEDTENGEGWFWGFYTSIPDYISMWSAAFWSNDLVSGTWRNYEYDISFSLTVTREEKQVPAVPMTLTGTMIEYADGLFTKEGAHGSLLGYEETPIEEGLYLMHDSKLIGYPIKFDKSKIERLFDAIRGMFVDIDFPFQETELKMYFSMDDKNDRVIDRITRTELVRTGGVSYRSDGVKGGCWENHSDKGAYMSAYERQGFGVEDEFTLIACINISSADYVQNGAPVIDIGAQQRDTGFGIRLGNDNTNGTIGVGLRVGSNEEGGHISVTPDSWHMVAFTWEKEGDHYLMRGYLDGAMAHSGEWSSSYAVKKDHYMAMFGRKGVNETADASAVCSIDEVYLYDGALEFPVIESMALEYEKTGKITIPQHNIFYGFVEGNATSNPTLANCVVTASNTGFDAKKLFQWGTQSVEIGAAPGCWIAVQMPNYSKISGAGLCNVGGGNIWPWKTCVLQGCGEDGAWHDIQTLSGSNTATGWGEEQYFDISTEEFYCGYRFLFTESYKDSETDVDKGKIRLGGLRLYSGTRVTE
ncbi:MAG: hypothetical protein IKD29_00535 [Lentisphaeria bacterium]|nr:hypothetical protein [Lentisphaeria bacterium]